MYIYCTSQLCINIIVPSSVGRVDVTCGPVDVINQCNVTWNVSVLLLHTYNVVVHVQQCMVQLNLSLTY